MCFDSLIHWQFLVKNVFIYFVQRMKALTIDFFAAQLELKEVKCLGSFIKACGVHWLISIEVLSHFFFDRALLVKNKTRI